MPIYGPVTPTTVADASGNWFTPNLTKIEDGNVGYEKNRGVMIGLDALIFSGFDFSAMTATDTVQGILFEGKWTAAALQNPGQNPSLAQIDNTSYTLVKAGNHTSSSGVVEIIPNGVLTWLGIGGPSDMFGNAWVPNDFINNLVTVSVICTLLPYNHGIDISLDSVRMTIYTSSAGGGGGDTNAGANQGSIQYIPGIGLRMLDPNFERITGKQ